MLKGDRRLREGDRPTLAIILTWLIVSAILFALASTRIFDNQFPDPDDALRLAQVRDLLAGQGWFDLHQYRMTPPEGTLMHWSRLVDLPIAGLILLFSQFMDMATAEWAAMIVTPLLVLLLTMLVMGRLAWRLFDRKTAIYACVVLVLMPVVPAQFQPLRIDHHGWQIFTVAFALWATSWRSAARGGMAAGLAMAVGLMISLETIFMSAGFALMLTLRWLRDHHQRWWLVSYLQSLALGLVILFGATRGLPDLAAHCDAISPPYLGFFLIVALGTGALAVLPALPRLTLLVALGFFGAVGVGFIGWSAPQCLASPFAGLDPLVRDYWYLNVTEGRPVWHRGLSESVPAVLQSLFALAVTLYLASRSRDWVRSWWWEYALLLFVAFLGGVLTYRSMAFAGVLAAIPMGWFVARIIKRWRSYEHLLPKAALAIVLYVVFLPGAFVVVLQKLAPPEPVRQSVRIAESSCELNRNAQLLDRLPPSTLFAPLDLGPALLLDTHHSVAASNHHRAAKAMHDVIYAFTHSPDEARKYVEAYRAGYVVACLDLAEVTNFRRGGGKDGLMNRLYEGDIPAWLEPVDLGGPDTLKVWRVITPAEARATDAAAPEATPGGNPAPAR